RRYPTVERRAREMAGAKYVAVPEDAAVLHPLLTELALTDPEKPFVAARDDCARPQRSPALELRLEGREGGALWPLLAVTQGGLILACLPLVDAPPEPRPPLPSLASVSQALSLLAGLQAFLCGPGGKAEGDLLASRLAILPAVVLQVCPLGTPLDTPQAGLPPAPSPPAAGAQKQPAWKPGGHRGRATVTVALSEHVRSMQYGSRTKQDLWDVFGTVTCKCELEGVLPNVTVTLSLPPNGSPLQDVLVHPCVTSLDSSVLTASSVDEGDGSAFSGPYKFPFSPPLEPFCLCSYTSQVGREERGHTQGYTLTDWPPGRMRPEAQIPCLSLTCLQTGPGRGRACKITNRAANQRRPFCLVVSSQLIQGPHPAVPCKKPGYRLHPHGC
ncbi:AP5M1 protein, partial [Atractosteus spatula]|nr:AP5M1 protein [Atractosteus spatula]